MCKSCIDVANEYFTHSNIYFVRHKIFGKRFFASNIVFNVVNIVPVGNIQFQSREKVHNLYIQLGYLVVRRSAPAVSLFSCILPIEVQTRAFFPIFIVYMIFRRSQRPGKNRSFVHFILRREKI